MHIASYKSIDCKRFQGRSKVPSVEWLRRTVIEFDAFKLGIDLQTRHRAIITLDTLRKYNHIALAREASEGFQFWQLQGTAEQSSITFDPVTLAVANELRSERFDEGIDRVSLRVWIAHSTRFEGAIKESKRRRKVFDRVAQDDDQGGHDQCLEIQSR